MPGRGSSVIFIGGLLGGSEVVHLMRADQRRPLNEDQTVKDEREKGGTALERWRNRVSYPYPAGRADGGAVPTNVRHVFYVGGVADLHLLFLGV